MVLKVAETTVKRASGPFAVFTKQCFRSAEVGATLRALPAKKRFEFLREKYQSLTQAEKNTLRREGKLIKHRQVTSVERKRKQPQTNAYAIFVRDNYSTVQGTPQQRIRIIAERYRKTLAKKPKHNQVPTQ